MMQDWQKEQLKVATGVTDGSKASAQPEQSTTCGEPVAWRDHVEQRLLTWRQSFVNRSGDQLALDDFMDKRSLDDLIEFVCDEYTIPPPVPTAQPEQEYKRGYADAMNWKVQNHLEHLPAAQPKQEPVAHVCVFPLRGDEFFPQTRIEWKNGRPVAGPLYTTPPQRTWVGLTLEEILETYRGPDGSDYVDYARGLEAKLKEKNT